MTRLGGIVLYMGRHAPISSQDAEDRSLAHELNNDLCVIIGECDLLLGISRETDVLARLEVIKTTAQRMADRISKGWSRPEGDGPVV